MTRFLMINVVVNLLFFMVKCQELYFQNDPNNSTCLRVNSITTNNGCLNFKDNLIYSIIPNNSIYTNISCLLEAEFKVLLFLFETEFCGSIILNTWKGNFSIDKYNIYNQNFFRNVDIKTRTLFRLVTIVNLTKFSIGSDGLDKIKLKKLTNQCNKTIHFNVVILLGLTYYLFSTVLKF